MDMAQDKKTAKKAVGMHESQLHGGKKSNLDMLKKGGKVKKMAGGGMPMVEKDGKKVPAFAADGVGKMKSGGKAKMTKGCGYSKGGQLSKANGIAVKGKTRGKIC